MVLMEHLHPADQEERRTDTGEQRGMQPKVLPKRMHLIDVLHLR